MAQKLWQEVLAWKAIAACVNAGAVSLLLVVPLSVSIFSRWPSSLVLLLLPVLAGTSAGITARLLARAAPAAPRQPGMLADLTRTIVGLCLLVGVASLLALAVGAMIMSPLPCITAATLCSTTTAFLQWCEHSFILTFPLIRRPRWLLLKRLLMPSIARGIGYGLLSFTLHVVANALVVADERSQPNIAVHLVYLHLSFAVCIAFGISVGIAVLAEHKRFCETHIAGVDAALTSLQRSAPPVIRHLALIDVAAQAHLGGSGAQAIFDDSSGKRWWLTTQSALDPLERVISALSEADQEARRLNSDANTRKPAQRYWWLSMLMKPVARKRGEALARSATYRQTVQHVKSLRVLAREGVQAASLLAAQAHALDTCGVSRLHSLTSHEVLAKVASAYALLIHVSPQEYNGRRSSRHRDLGSEYTKHLLDCKAEIDELFYTCERCLFWMLENNNLTPELPALKADPMPRCSLQSASNVVASVARECSL